MKRQLLGTMTVMIAMTVAAPARAQVSEARIKELLKQAAERAAVTADQVPQTQMPGQARPVVRLTLDDAVKFALERNLDIAVQRLNPEISDIAVLTVKSVYNPTLTSTVGPQSATLLPSSQTQLGSGGAAIVQDTMVYNGGIA